MSLTLTAGPPSSGSGPGHRRGRASGQRGWQRGPHPGTAWPAGAPIADRLTAAASPLAAFAGLTVGLLVLRLNRHDKPGGGTPAHDITAAPPHLRSGAAGSNGHRGHEAARLVVPGGAAVQDHTRGARPQRRAAHARAKRYRPRPGATCCGGRAGTVGCRTRRAAQPAHLGAAAPRRGTPVRQSATAPDRAGRPGRPVEADPSKAHWPGSTPDRRLGACALTTSAPWSVPD